MDDPQDPVVPAGTPGELIQHVYPLGDMREHITEGQRACWCRPHVELVGAGYLVTHNAMDGREKFETGERKPS